ncbi:wall-associated receptor kinase 2-like [Ziziphus jujuba]|uniref:Wall-associated receptor kinase 2-like n=1 Tax=Ziziphus jujuba TaxID=326968 RepID=A0ABM4A1J6_ZIZJJ|nr:wall-associated receptor kinase 2-like [Ziziphus jujuba]
MVVLRLHFHEPLWLSTTLLFLLVAASSDQLDSSGCVRHCGDIDILYPFGLTEKCCLDHNFLIQCDNSSGHPTPLIGTNNLTVTRISAERSEMSIQFDVTRDCYTKSGDQIPSNKSVATLTPPNTMFTFSHKNIFTVVGCESYSYLNAYDYNNQRNFLILETMCSSLEVVESGSCSGLGCAQRPSLYGRLQNITLEAYSFNKHKYTRDFNNCSYAFIVDKSQFNFSRNYVTNFPQEKLPLLLDWAISQEYDTCGKNSRRQGLEDGSGYYYCLCKDGFQGNPYQPDGCKDINECENPSLNNCSETRYCINMRGSYTCSCPSWFKGDGRRGGTGCKDQLPGIKAAIGVAIGFITLLISGTWIYLVSKQRRLIKLKEKFFRQNGGIILQQQLSRRNDTNEMAKIFTELELKKATNNYNESTIIGKGGFGIVYKGTLPDNRIVAIKKSKIMNQTQIKQFINEVVVLSQINHRNVVKLLGCCLETEVPLLVYEFVPNGNLFEHIHNRDKAYNFPWATRLGIAAETAGALSYLHSAASTPIIHRDVKSSNILLDNSMTAKVSDFGASRLIPLGQTEVATLVQGTLGYLDPEYLQTNQLTEKSDVYSFGVVLVELLTGEKALSFNRPEEKRNLAMHFLYSLVEGKLYEMLESRMVNEENREQLKEVAGLAKRCLSLKGEDRPTMKEVAMELEGIRRTERHPWVKTELNLEETESLLNDQTSNAYKDYYGKSVSHDAITLDFSGR